MPNNSSPKLNNLLARIRIDFPSIEFIESTHFSWHAGSKLVSYKSFSQDDMHGVWALLHEVGHALLEHSDYKTDVELLNIEVDAWEQARNLSEKYELEIEENYIQDCIDTYRDWLHVRSTCPTCFERSLQIDKQTYRCLNCRTVWHVTRNRLCRPYRKRSHQPLK